MDTQTYFNIGDIGQYFYKLAEKSQDVFWVRASDYKTQLYVSPAYETIWGLSCASLHEDSDSWLKTVVSQDRRGVERAIHELKNNHQPDAHFLIEYRIRRADRKLRWIQELGFPLFNNDKTLFGYAGIAKDITKEKQNQEIANAVRFFQFFAEKSSSVFWVRDPTLNKQIFVSAAYEKIWGRSCQSLYNNPDSWIDTVYPEDQTNRSVENRMRLLEQNPSKSTQYEERFRIKRPDGSIVWVKDTHFPIYDEKNKFIGFAGISDDVTKDVLHEQELVAAKHRAELANHAKTEFLAMMSHELRTPLNAIIGMSEILKHKGVTSEQAEYVDIIHNAGNNLLALVSDILDFVRLETWQLKILSDPFHLRDLFNQVVKSLRYQAADKGLYLDLKFSGNIPVKVIGDANRLRQILINLITNAIKFTNKGGIRISVQCVSQQKTKAAFMLTVKDTGIGIHEDNIKFIFEKFSQVDSTYQRKQQGVGLGLAIAKELVEKMGGEIKVTSVMGAGSEFVVTLPFKLQKGATKLVKKSKKIAVAALRSSYNVLLVEDNLINQKIAKIMLQDLHCKVEIVDSGMTALTHLKACSTYDVIFMDIGLPDINGFEVVKKIRKNPAWRNLPIVAMTAHILERDRKKALAAGMNGLIVKPISHEDIKRVLVGL